MNQLFKLALGALPFCAAAFSQTSILAVDIENIVNYNQDTADVTKWATSAEQTDPLVSQNFVPIIWLADVVAANINIASMCALVGAGFYAATLLMRTMVPLRISA